MLLLILLFGNFAALIQASSLTMSSTSMCIYCTHYPCQVPAVDGCFNCRSISCSEAMEYSLTFPVDFLADHDTSCSLHRVCDSIPTADGSIWFHRVCSEWEASAPELNEESYKLCTIWTQCESTADFPEYCENQFNSPSLSYDDDSELGLLKKCPRSNPDCKILYAKKKCPPGKSGCGVMYAEKSGGPLSSIVARTEFPFVLSHVLNPEGMTFTVDENLETENEALFVEVFMPEFESALDLGFADSVTVMVSNRLNGQSLTLRYDAEQKKWTAGPALAHILDSGSGSGLIEFDLRVAILSEEAAEVLGRENWSDSPVGVAVVSRSTAISDPSNGGNDVVSAPLLGAGIGAGVFVLLVLVLVLIVALVGGCAYCQSLRKKRRVLGPDRSDDVQEASVDSLEGGVVRIWGDVEHI